jgi:hypothetical protein
LKRDALAKIRGAGEDRCGPLKEDRSGGKLKYVPAPSDALAVLGPHLAHRRAAGAGPEDFAFRGTPLPG